MPGLDVVPDPVVAFLARISVICVEQRRVYVGPGMGERRGGEIILVGKGSWTTVLVYTPRLIIDYRHPGLTVRRLD